MNAVELVLAALIVVIITLLGMSIWDEQRQERACEAKGGVLVWQERLCLDRNARL